MSLTIIALTAILIYSLAYYFIGGWLSRIFGLRKDFSTPAVKINDGEDFVPTRKVEVLGAYKSIGGSLAFGVGVMAALSLTWNIGNIAIWKILLSLVILEVAEFLNWRGIDNVTLPIASLGLGVLLF